MSQDLHGGLALTVSSSPHLDSQESRWFTSSTKARSLETQEELMFYFKSEGRKELMLQFKANQAGEIAFSLLVPFMPQIG